MRLQTIKILRVALFMGLFLIADFSFGQCPMCRSAVESGLMEEGNKIGIGLNDGILYLLATPYLVVLIVGGLWYRKYRKSH